MNKIETTSEEIIQRLLIEKKITVTEALQLLKDIAKNNSNYTPVWPVVPNQPMPYPYSLPIVYC